MNRNHRSRALGALTLALACAPTTALALPLLSEVFYDAVGADDGLLFVELVGLPGSSLDGFSIDGVNGANGEITVSVALAGVFPADGIYVLADTASDGTTAVASPDGLANFDFQNGPDSIVLRYGESVIDAIGYGVFGPSDFFAGEGAPAPDAPPGASLARRWADVDSDDNAADWVVGLPSPGSAALADIPEPSTVALLTGGLGLLAGSLRRRARRRSGLS